MHLPDDYPSGWFVPITSSARVRCEPCDLNAREIQAGPHVITATDPVPHDCRLTPTQDQQHWLGAH
jgi:hypothetical protein